MPAKKLLLATLVASLLAGCGGTPTQALPGDGTYDDGSYATDDTSLGTDPYGSTADPYATGTGSADGSVGDPNATGYTLRGLVTDQQSQILAGAKVSIGAQTTLTNERGEFEITGITDSQIWVDVSKDGYESITRFNIQYSATEPIADKEFKLAASGTGSSGSSGGGTSVGPILSHDGTFGGPKWTSVAAMAVNGDNVYVLGKLDKTLWFDRSAVVVFNANTGEETGRIGDTLFSKVPKAASSIKVDDGQVIVSDGTNRATFDAAGAFVKTAAGGGYSAVKTVADDDRNIKYELKTGNKVTITSSAKTETLSLEDVGNAKSIALDGAGHLLVLDDSQKTVHLFSYE